MSIEHQKTNSLRDKVQKSLTDPVECLQLFPAVTIKLLQLTNDDNTDFHDLSKVIETELSLAAQVLKTVNSALFNFPQAVNSIQRAISILGFSGIRNIAIKLLFYNSLIVNQANQSFNLLFFWQHCLFTATLSRDIAINLDYPDPDLIYTAGLLHDIGKLVLENYGKVSYSDFISSYANSTPSSLQDELTFFGVSHEQVGQVFCQQSQLPDIITAVVARHNSSIISDNDCYFDFKKEIAIVSFANYLAWAQGIGSFSTETPPLLAQTVLEIIEIEKLDIESLLDHVDQEMQSTSEFYNIHFPTLSQLRAQLIQTSIQFSKSNFHNTHTDTDPTNFLSSLTIPHQSLDPEIFIPQTLRAIHKTFNFDRVFMLNMNIRHRSLVAKYYWLNPLAASNDHTLEIKVDALSGDLLSCLRNQHAAIISEQSYKNRKLLKQIGVTEFLAVPILRNNRLNAVLYADNKFSKAPIKIQTLTEIFPIATELGSALYNAKRFELERSKAELDPLTGLSNKRMIKDFLEKYFTNQHKEPEKMAVGFLDIDHFKKINDDCGHQTGDEALKIVADILRSLTRDGDFIGRYGGEEFVFVLTDCSLKGASQFAERIRAEIEAKGIILKHRFNNNELTVSIGIAMFQRQHKPYQDLIAAADKAMYQAKNSGRNKVVVQHET